MRPVASLLLLLLQPTRARAAAASGAGWLVELSPCATAGTAACAGAQALLRSWM
jgi:hypothetical protein